jgi:hypothetical protein
MASGSVCRANRSDTWPHQPALQRHSKTPANGGPSTQGRFDPFGRPSHNARSGKKLKQFGWIHEMACPKPNVLYVAELLNWRVQKLLLG